MIRRHIHPHRWTLEFNGRGGEVAYCYGCGARKVILDARGEQPRRVTLDRPQTP